MYVANLEPWRKEIRVNKMLQCEELLLDIPGEFGRYSCVVSFVVPSLAWEEVMPLSLLDVEVRFRGEGNPPADTACITLDPFNSSLK